jgi:pSer/pThr/pTyr-binding forkhead associated (FHA) protein
MGFSNGNEANGHGDVESTQRFSSDFLSQATSGLDSEEQAAIAALPSGSGILVVRRGPNEGARFLLDSDVTTVGRHPNADIFLDDVTVSRRHAEFVRTGTKFSLTDLGSLNGSYYNGVRVDAAVLENGGEVQIGKFRMTFYKSSQDA